jgi:hypothetical protein
LLHTAFKAAGNSTSRSTKPYPPARQLAVDPVAARHGERVGKDGNRQGPQAARRATNGPSCFLSGLRPSQPCATGSASTSTTEKIPPSRFANISTASTTAITTTPNQETFQRLTSDRKS